MKVIIYKWVVVMLLYLSIILIYLIFKVINLKLEDQVQVAHLLDAVLVEETHVLLQHCVSAQHRQEVLA